MSDSCQITPTNGDQHCREADTQMACSLAFNHPGPTQTTVRPNLQARGRRFEPGTLHLREALLHRGFVVSKAVRSPITRPALVRMYGPLGHGFAARGSP